MIKISVLHAGQPCLYSPCIGTLFAVVVNADVNVVVVDVVVVVGLVLGREMAALASGRCQHATGRFLCLSNIRAFFKERSLCSKFCSQSSGLFKKEKKN